MICKIRRGNEATICWVNRVKINMAIAAAAAGIIGRIMENSINERVIAKTPTEEKDMRNDAIATPLYPYHMINNGDITHVNTVHITIK